MCQSNFYLYRHIRPDKNEPFYIGIGRGNRAFTRWDRNDIWNKIVAKNNGEYDIEIMLHDLSRETAIEKEREFISLYGRKDLGSGCLANMTDGGDGTTSPSKQVRRKISKANKGKVLSKKHIQALIVAGKARTGAKNPMYGRSGEDHHRSGVKHTQDSRRKMSANRTDKKPVYCYDYHDRSLIAVFESLNSLHLDSGYDLANLWRVVNNDPKRKSCRIKNGKLAGHRVKLSYNEKN